MSEAITGSQPRGLEQKWKILISVMFGIFMIILDATVVNVAFPTLRREFGATLADAQWVLSIYVLSLGVTTPISGYLADRFGIKRVYLFGLAVFVIGSFFCGLAPSLGWLIAARLARLRWWNCPAAGSGAALPGVSTKRARHGTRVFWDCPGVRPGSRSDPGWVAGGCGTLAGYLLY
jgi:MFS family permease